MKLTTQRISIVLLPAVLLVVGMFAMPADEATVGQAAPGFSLPGTDNEMYSLAGLEGQFVVLEWLNFGCPYVKRHYNSGNMPALQDEFTGKDVVWLSIVSSAPGTQGYYPAAEMNAENEEFGGNQTAILLDPEGDVGRMYGAQTTPHMYVINPEGTLIYKGGIDDKPRARESETNGSPNFVSAALEEAMNGKEVSVKTARPYGCSVKYK